MGHTFEVDRHIETGATPEQVWEAITTGAAIDSWFMGRNDVEPRKGGRVSVVHPAFTAESTITAWDPPRRFVHRADEAEDGTFHQFEYRVEPRGKGSDVRWLHIGFLGTEDWEAEYEAMGEGDPMYLHKLAQYLTYFRGRHATPIDAFGPSVSKDEVWHRYREALGIPEHTRLDDWVRLTPEGLEPVEGVIDYVSRDFLGVRTDHALYRFIHAFTGDSMIGHHDFRPGVDKEAADAAWTVWLAKVFA